MDTRKWSSPSDPGFENTINYLFVLYVWDVPLNWPNEKPMREQLFVQPLHPQVIDCHGTAHVRAMSNLIMPMTSAKLSERIDRWNFWTINPVPIFEGRAAQTTKGRSSYAKMDTGY